MSEPKAPATVSVIVPAHNAAATLPRTLTALKAQVIDVPFEVIVVDNGSTDSTQRIAEEAGVQVIRREPGTGPGPARNAGVAAARGDLLAFTDSDCAPVPTWLTAGVEALRGAGLVQGRVEPPPGVVAGPLDKAVWVTYESGLFETANLFVRREVFEALGGFGDGLFPVVGAPFGEDVIFGWRARRAGVATTFSDAALIHHEVFPRAPGEFLRAQSTLRFFPWLAHHAPELRETFFHRRWFLDRRRAWFALAVGGGLAALLTRRPAAALAVVPYGRLLAREQRAYGTQVVVVLAAGDALGLAVLAWGSVRFRALLL